jgi:hypothetical protein
MFLKIMVSMNYCLLAKKMRYIENRKSNLLLRWVTISLSLRNYLFQSELVCKRILEYPKTKMNNKSQLNLQKKFCNLCQSRRFQLRRLRKTPRKATSADVLCGRREWTSNGSAFHLNAVPGSARSAFAKKTLSIPFTSYFRVEDRPGVDGAKKIP